MTSLSGDHQLWTEQGKSFSHYLNLTSHHNITSSYFINIHISLNWALTDDWGGPVFVSGKLSPLMARSNQVNGWCWKSVGKDNLPQLIINQWDGWVQGLLRNTSKPGLGWDAGISAWQEVYIYNQKIKLKSRPIQPAHILSRRMQMWTLSCHIAFDRWANYLG